MNGTHLLTPRGRPIMDMGQMTEGLDESGRKTRGGR
jgi:hypothetical protein